MKISIIIPVYNEEIYVRECIESLLKQTGFDFEIIVIDDASTDNTAQSVLAFNDARIHLYRNETNLGVGLSRIKGFELSSGDYVWFVDADDYIIGDVLSYLTELGKYDIYNLPYEGFVGTYRAKRDTELKTPIDLLYIDPFTTLQNKIISRKVLERNILSPLHYMECEETYFNLLINAESCFTYKDSGSRYFYRKNNKSLSHTLGPKYGNAYRLLVWLRFYDHPKLEHINRTTIQRFVDKYRQDGTKHEEIEKLINKFQL